jgi:hypothetical protein
MAEHQYGSVRRSLVNFAPALTDKENVQLRVFGDTVSNPLEGRGGEVAGKVEGFLPQEPFFSHTDLGLAILKGLEFLERGDASQVQTFFLLTDGLHHPPADSPYSRDFDSDPDWQDLRRRAEALCQRRTVFVYGFGLGQQTDISVLRRVFPTRNVEVIVGDATQVAYALRRVRELLSREQLRRAVEHELSEGKVEVRLAQTSVTGNAESFEVPLTIRNDYRHLPVVVEQFKVQRGRGDGPEIECKLESAPSNAALEAGKQWQGKAEGTLHSELPRWRVGESEQDYKGAFTFVPVVRFQHEAALDNLGLDSTPSRADAALSVDLRVSYGIPYWPFVLVVLFGTAMVGAAFVRRRRMEEQMEAVSLRHAERRRLAGVLKIWPALKDEPDGDGVDLRVYEEERLELASAEDGGLKIVVPEEMTGKTVARLSGHLIGASPDDGESGQPEFRIEVAAGHRLAYESEDEMREASGLALCHNDTLELDNRWRLRYVNHGSRPRYEAEAAR